MWKKEEQNFCIILEIMINSLSCPEKGKNKEQHAVTIHPQKVIKPCDLLVHSQLPTPGFQNSFFGLEFKGKK